MHDKFNNDKRKFLLLSLSNFELEVHILFRQLQGKSFSNNDAEERQRDRERERKRFSIEFASLINFKNASC